MREASMWIGRCTPTGVGTIRASGRRARGRAGHPHGRGDNDAVGTGLMSDIGSPPRAWGQLRRSGHCAPAVRFTPTGVGTICGGSATRWCATVHPHGRGDNRTPSSSSHSPIGSPPRAWGQCRTGRRNPPAVRFTPTGVGTIATLRGSLRPSAVHPHGRGDNATVRRSLSIRPVHPHGRGDNSISPY